MGKIKVPTIKQVTKNPASLLALTGPVGMAAATGANMVSANMGGGAQPPELQEDPRLTELRNKMSGEAAQFRKDMPGLLAKEREGIKSSADAALGQGIKNTRQNFNRRGLLYSGHRQGGEQTVRGNVASQMAAQTRDVNKKFEDIASAKENAAATVGLQGYGEALQRANDLYDSQLANSVARQQSMQQLGQGLGYLGGQAYANSRPQSPVTTSNAYYNPNSYATNFR